MNDEIQKLTSDCFNSSCKSHDVACKFWCKNKLAHSEGCENFYDGKSKPKDLPRELIIHDKCGLPVELCECPDAEVRYDKERGVFVVQNEGDHEE